MLATAPPKFHATTRSVILTLSQWIIGAAISMAAPAASNTLLAANVCDMSTYVTHDVDITDDVSLLVREGSPMRSRVSSFIDGDEDHTGNYVWPSSYVLAKWLSSNAAETQGKTVLELGSGCGLAGLTVAAMGAAKEVILTDLSSATLSNLEHNVALQDSTSSRTEVRKLDWRASETWPATGSVDYALGADLVYDDGMAPSLAQVLAHSLKDDGEFIHVHPKNGRVGTSELAGALAEVGLTLVEELPLPERDASGAATMRTWAQLTPVAGEERHSLWHVLNEVATKEFVLQRYKKVKA